MHINRCSSKEDNSGVCQTSWVHHSNDSEYYIKKKSPINMGPIQNDSGATAV
jgi:hypothetical protein